MKDCNCGAQTVSNHRPHSNNCNVYVEELGQFNESVVSFRSMMGDKRNWVNGKPNLLLSNAFTKLSVEYIAIHYSDQPAVTYLALYNEYERRKTMIRQHWEHQLANAE